MKFDGIEQFLKEGKEKEITFSSIFKNYEFSTEKQDMIEHWDVKVGNIKIDVKGLKKINRYDNQKNENIHWIEIKNVNGDLGWAYGEADYFAFETIDYWIIVKKDNLQELIKKVAIKEWVKRPELYKLYQRKDRKDVVTLIKTLDLCFVSDCLIAK
jgi:hypothetical protein